MNIVVNDPGGGVDCLVVPTLLFIAVSIVGAQLSRLQGSSLKSSSFACAGRRPSAALRTVEKWLKTKKHWCHQ